MPAIPKVQKEPIILDDSFLFTKAASKGKDAIFEKDNTDKYNFFKKYVKSKVVKFVSNIDGIPTVIHSHLNDIQLEYGDELCGWIRNKKSSEQLIANAEQYTTEFGIKQIPLGELFRNAKKEIYIFGNTLVSLYNEKEALLKLLNSGIEVKLLTMDLLDKENYARNCDYYTTDIERMCRSSGLAFLRMEEIRNEYSGDKFQVKVTPFPLSICIVATDIEENGMIIATHILPTKEYTKNCLTAKICADHVFYERYRMYVKKFWNKKVREVDAEYYNELKIRKLL